MAAGSIDDRHVVAAQPGDRLPDIVDFTDHEIDVVQAVTPAFGEGERMMIRVGEATQEVCETVDRIRTAEVERFLHDGGGAIQIGRAHDDVAEPRDLRDRRRERRVAERLGCAVELHGDIRMRLGNPDRPALVKARALGGIHIENAQPAALSLPPDRSHVCFAFHLKSEPLKPGSRAGIEHDIVMIVAAPEISLARVAPGDQLQAEQTLVEVDRALDVGDVQSHISELGIACHASRP